MNLIDRFAIQVAHTLSEASFKMCVVLLAAWVVTLLMRRASGASRHLVWTLSVASILALPVLEGILPKWHVAVLPAAPERQISSHQASVGMVFAHQDEVAAPAGFLSRRDPENDFDLRHVTADGPALIQQLPPIPTATRHPIAFWLFLVWGTGVVGLAVFGIAGAAMVRRTERRAVIVRDGRLWLMLEEMRRQLMMRRQVRLLIADSAAMPIAWGIFQPRILLPSEATNWPEDRARSVLLHELAHVRRWDCATQVMAFFAVVIYWFNPLVWLAERKMRVERERACDDIVIGRGSSATEYAEYLVLLARSFGTGNLQNVGAVAMARRSGLADRVKAILNANINRRELNYRAKLTGMIAILAILLPLSAVQLMKKSAASNAALAADVLAQATTMPASVDEQLPPLPARISSKRIPIQVLSPQGRPLRIDSIQTIEVWIEPQMPWIDGPTPQILARYADGWVLVDKEMFALAQPGQRVDLIFSSGGSALEVSGKYPTGSPKKITFNALFDANEIGVDRSAGPAAAKDEVAGQVVDRDGKSVAGAVVFFPDAYGEMMHKPFTTGGDGVFRFSGLNDNQYIFLNVEKSGYAKRILVNVPVGRGFLVHMDGNTRIKGQFLGSDGFPASNAKIDFVTSKASGRADHGDTIPDLTVSADADGQGRYDVPLEPGEYEIRVTATNGFGRYAHVQVASGQIVGMSEKLESGAKLKIVAIDTLTNKPASGVKFFIWDRGSGFVMSEKKDSERTTGAGGAVEWGNLMPGRVEVDVRSDVYGQWWTDEMRRGAGGRFIDALEIDVSQGMAPVTAHLEPGVHVTGTVVSPDGKPVSGAEVNIGGLGTGDARYAKRTDEMGSFALTFPVLNMNAGNGNEGLKYAIVASDMQHRWANATGDWFTPSVGQTFSLTLKMKSGARLRGRVVGKDGKPVANVQVRAQADDRLDCTYYDPRALSDEHGRFELGPMRPVHYSIYFAGNFNDIWRLSVPAALTMSVADGDRVDIGDVTYDGRAPSLSPGEMQEFANRRAVPETNDASWRQVKPAANPVVVPPPGLPAATARQSGTPAAEDELLGNPATPGLLSGKVVNDKGDPIAGVSIQVWTWMPGRGDITDENGRFTLRKLDAGRNVEIRFSKEGFCPKYIPQQPTGLSDLNVVLTNKTYFEGHVTGPDGNPVAGAKIRADQGPKQADGVTITSVWTETKADAHGNYKLYVQPDAYDIQVRVPGVGVARTGKTPIGDGEARHLDLALIPGITFHAKVVDSNTGEPVAGVRLYSYEHKGIEGRSDSTGNLTIDFMEPGRFEFDIDAKGYARWWSDQAASEWNRRQFINRNGKWERNFDNLDFDMQPQMPATTIVVEREVTIRGKVVDPDGRPVVGATVAPALTGTGNSLTGDTRFSVSSKAGGIFVMELPASGDHDYNLTVHDGKYQKWRKWANGVLPPIRTKPGQELDDITMTLTRPAVVRGRVLDADGNPVANREVRAVASDLLENRYYDPTVRTDKDGNFALKYVRPGQQIIQVAPFWLTPAEAPVGSSQTVTLIEGQVLENVSLTGSAN
jgi:beta-lactamase regulating signal transducer with metallopeptidase domain/protocatechuate 3,4-dioxygenase beta subunit